jgi:hypothetical protein
MANVLKYVNTHCLQTHHVLFRVLSNAHTNNYYHGGLLQCTTFTATTLHIMSQPTSIRGSSTRLLIFKLPCAASGFSP